MRTTERAAAFSAGVFVLTLGMLLLTVPPKASAMELQAAGVELGKNYPFPIVDHAEQRVRAIALLKGSRA